MVLGGQRHPPAALPAGTTRYKLCRRLGGPNGRSGRLRKTSPPPGFDPRSVQLVASRYTNCEARPTIQTVDWLRLGVSIFGMHVENNARFCDFMPRIS